ncbi:DNA polymerase III subunit beta [Streptomyces qinglanensis]|uniref:DNA polymerase III subunit beta n=1 Tax=Streptomyces qinglanensis TaxID=943816 RepID=A0A1E7K8B0_9ACTN|nr:DNA-processing protein DprA [Streptomyces qinglanensis]OEV00126.1 DNA polymerase III subunit beta [Streptomyces qinglanensis]
MTAEHPRPGAERATPGGTPPPPPPPAVPEHGEPAGPDGCAAPHTAAATSRRATGQPGAARPGQAPEEPERLARAALTRIAEPGDELVGRWLAAHGACAVVAALNGSGPALGGTGERRWAGLRLRAARARPHADLAAIVAGGGRFVCPGDSEWPRQLDDLGHTAPFGLWLRGEPSLRLWALRSVAVVGARACTEYGAHCAAALGAGLAERGWTVVSGAAYGIDAAAHRGALAVRGPTAGVLACGADVAYPPGNQELIRAVGERGLLIAELPPGDHPTRSRFVLRNRVIAALTRGTVVVEAALRSGALVTARRALVLGRQLMGVPGPVTSGLSQGVHELLRGEATVVTDADEVIEQVGMVGELAPERRAPAVPRDALSPGAARVLEALPGRGTGELARIACSAGAPPGEVLARLHELRALGFVERDGECWQLTALGKGHPIG